MSKQKESLWVADPMNDHGRGMEWHVTNIHGNKFQSGMPDSFWCKAGMHDRWIEYKIIYGNSISFTPAQMKKFPVLIAAGVWVYIICTRTPLRNDYPSRQRLYNKIMKEPNGKWVTMGKSYYNMLY